MMSSANKANGKEPGYQFCFTFMTMHVFFTLNLRPGIDSAANFTSIYTNFSD